MKEFDVTDVKDGLISRRTAFEVLTEYYHQRMLPQKMALKEALERVPDDGNAQRVVRCTACKHFTPPEQGADWGKCDQWYSDVEWVLPNDYCSYAERKEE